MSYVKRCWLRFRWGLLRNRIVNAKNTGEDAFELQQEAGRVLQELTLLEMRRRA